MSQAFGTPWGHTRSYVHRQVHQQSLAPISEDRGQGSNWQVQQWPYLVQRVDDQGQLLGYVVQGQSNEQLWFDMDNGQLAARFGSKQTLAFDRESWTFVLTDPSGNVTNFAAFDQIESGMFLCHSDPGGVVTKVVAFHSSGQRIGEVQRTDGNVVESLLYQYSTTPTWDNVPRLDLVTLRRKEGQGNWSTISTAGYAHYGNQMDPASAHGSLGDLKTVSVSGAGGGTPCMTAYRYYKGGGSSSGSGGGGGSSSSGGGVGLGEKHLLKYVLNPASYERFVADGHLFTYASDLWTTAAFFPDSACRWRPFSPKAASSAVDLFRCWKTSPQLGPMAATPLPGEGPLLECRA